MIRRTPCTRRPALEREAEAGGPGEAGAGGEVGAGDGGVGARAVELDEELGVVDAPFFVEVAGARAIEEVELERELERPAEAELDAARVVVVAGRGAPRDEVEAE